ncbi:MAG: isoaspartyl peptidase/L-asparaginase [Kofleriaceae bacterium]
MIIVHGGVGPVAPDRMEKVRQGLRAAALAGHQLIERGASSLDAVVAAVRKLEDDPEFGAGFGSALTRDGDVETCASVMDGSKRRAGAVAAAPNLAQPVIVARAILERGEQVVMAGPGALNFAHEIGLDPVKPGALVTPQAQQALQAVLAKKASADSGGVGAVARDKNGKFASAASTGGTIGRRPGVVDDASVPGIGVWADEAVAVSTSGGEALYRIALAHNIALRVTKGESQRNATKHALQELAELVPGAFAGAIAVDKNSWSALQIGPAMPVAWIDDFGPNEAIGFPL